MKNKIEFFIVILALTLLIAGCSPGSVSDESSLSTTPTAQDNQLSNVISNNGLAKLTAPAAEASDLVALGEALFADVDLSGNRNISCLSCHDTAHGTVDGLPFSIGTGAAGIGSVRRQINGTSLPTARNAPSLYNLGRTNQIRAFLDGRVSFNNRVIASTVNEISGANPTRADISTVFTNAYDVQPMFPLLSTTEMLGANNDLSAHSTEVAVWQSILTDRLLTKPAVARLFARAYPSVATAQLNPGHIGRAIGAFMKSRFQSTNTPFDRYLAGDLTALTEAQKRGMVVFYTRGQCVRCHSGSNFTDLGFHSSGVPQIGTTPFVDDLGRASITGLTADRYKFKTPSLRNIALTAPYMHDGAFDTLEAVVNHYNNVRASLASYTIPPSYQGFYQLALALDQNTTRNNLRLNQIDNGAIRNGLGLSTQEKADLVNFLRNGLRDANFN